VRENCAASETPTGTFFVSLVPEEKEGRKERERRRERGGGEATSNVIDHLHVLGTELLVEYRTMSADQRRFMDEPLVGVDCALHHILS